MVETTHYGTGRRKESIARVYMRPGTGKITVNSTELRRYFGRESLCMIVQQPLEHLGMDNQFDCSIFVRGGGIGGQASAARLGLARALLEYDQVLRPRLRERGFLTRDARIVERKKVGLRKARKDKQFSKR